MGTRQSTMDDVVRYLRRQRPYIQPMILNRDTGEKIWMEEIKTKVPQGYDPKHLNKSPSRVDFGAWLSNPVARHIPRWISPNQITMANQVLAWAVFGLAFTFACSTTDLSLRKPECRTEMLDRFWSLFATPAARAGLLLLLSLGNMANMIMDCLDGIHARATNQCSRFGEVLDHWFDAMTTPLMGSVALIVIQPCQILQITMLITITMLYNSQLIFFHYERVFLHTAGVEGQVAMSAVFLVYALAQFVPALAAHLPMVSNILAAAVTVSTLHLDWFYVQRFNEKAMLLEHALYLAVCSTVGGLYFTGFCTQLSFFMIILTVSFRINGSYVIYSVINWVYRGFDARLLEYVTLMLLMHYVMAPLPLELFYDKLRPYLGDCGLTLQDMLPTIMCIDLIMRNMFDIQRSVKALSDKDLADKYQACITHAYLAPGATEAELQQALAGSRSASPASSPLPQASLFGSVGMDKCSLGDPHKKHA